MRNTVFLVSLCWSLVALPSYGTPLPEDPNAKAPATLRLCPAGETYASVTSPTGSRKGLSVAENAGESEACGQLRLPVDHAGLRQARFVADTPGLSENMILFRPSNQVETTTKAERRANQSARRIAPLARNLLALLSARPFGIEERVTLDKETVGLMIHCRSGNRPAGVLLEDPERVLPNLEKVDLRIVAEHSGGFEVALHDPHSAKPKSLGALPQGSGFMSLPAANPVRGPRYPLAFSLHCPDAGGEARLDRIELLPNVSTGLVDSPMRAGGRHPDLW